MPSHLSQIKLLDLRMSVLDDGKVTELRTKYGEEKHKLVGLKGDAKKEQDLKVKHALKGLKDAEAGFARTIDESRRRGVFKFRIKRYIDYSGNTPYPAHYCKWCRYAPTNGYREYQTWLATGWEPVSADQDPYWPEGIVANAERRFTFGDVILMKMNLKRYLVEKIENLQISMGATKAELDRFRSDVEKHGGEVPDSYVDSYMSKVELNQ